MTMSGQNIGVLRIPTNLEEFYNYGHIMLHKVTSQYFLESYCCRKIQQTASKSLNLSHR
jgi:hypothetical protein